MRKRAIALVTALALIASACTGGGDDSDDGAPSIIDPRFTTAELRYGRAPQDAPGVEYQDDVVIIDGGPEAIRGMSPDGLSWTIDGDAGGMGDLDVGEVMFVTGRAVGRVLAIEEVDGDKKVTIGPVDITEVYRELDLQFEQPIELASMPLLEAPELPGTATDIKLLPEEGGEESSAGERGETTPDDPTTTLPGEGDIADPDESTEGDGSVESIPDEPLEPDDSVAPEASGDTTEGAAPAWDEPIELDPVRLIAFPSQPTAERPIDPLGSVRAQTLDINDFKSTIYSRKGVGVGLKYDKGGVRFDVLMHLRLNAPTVSFDLKISDGRIQRAAVDMRGAAGLTLSFSAASQVGLANNVGGRIVLPVDISVPVFGIAVPFSITFSQRIMVKTAFSAKNSTLKATGDYTLSGGFSMGYENGSLRMGGPTGLTTNQSLVESIDSISVGVNGIVLTHAVRVIVGIGAFGFATGPYFDFISSFGVTSGSDLGIVKCRGGSLDIFLGAGIGYQIPAPVSDAINFFLRALNLKQIERVKGIELARSNIVHKEGITPASKICREGAQ